MRISFISPTCYIDFDDWKIVFEEEEKPGEKQETKISQSQLYKILEFFAEHPGEYVSKKTLLKECWGIEIEEGDKGFDSTFYPQMSNCRKLNREVGEAIKNEPGRGYKYCGGKISGSSLAAGLDMSDVRGFCIGDQDHSGCQVRRDESGPKATTAVIDFSLTDSKLCSVVYFTGLRDWSQLAADHRLCFEARAVPGPVQAEVEVRLRGGDFPYPVLIPEEGKTFEIPLSQIASAQAWSEVQEIHLLFRRRAVEARTAVTVENLRLER